MIDRQLLADRLNQAFDYLKSKGVVHTNKDFAEAIGKDASTLSQAFKAKGRAMTLGLLARVAETFPDLLNKEYLLTGKGELAKPDKSMRPHIPVSVAAGFMDGASDAIMTAELFMQCDKLPAYDFTIDVKGNSMEPEIKAGDVLACKRIIDRLNIPTGKICVIDTKNGPLVKIITGVENGQVKLHSLNSDYRDLEIEPAEVLGIAKVVGIIRKVE